MTLDTLTRAQAELSHLRLQTSLAQATQDFRTHFQHDERLFRSLPIDSPAPLDRSASPAARAAKAHELDLVRGERFKQCCKRVRVWRRLASNPLLQYKNQQAAATKTGAGKKRMHVTVLVALIVDMYEQHFLAACERDPANLDAQETFPEFVAKYISQRASSRRVAVDQLHSIVASVLRGGSGHRRVQLFGSLCGLDDDFNPPERSKVFLRVLSCLLYWKLAEMGKTRADDPSCSVGTVVFLNVGITQRAAEKVVAELFHDDDLWNFCFWHAPCRELGVASDWPRDVCIDVQRRAVALAASSRNALLNASRKIDSDAFLELLMSVWTERAKELFTLLDAATDKEEHDGATRLQSRQFEQDARAQRRPSTESERELFAELVTEFWNADVPWASARLQRRLSTLTPARPPTELQELYASYVAGLEAPQRPWEWQHWAWDAEWEWGALVIKDRLAAS